MRANLEQISKITGLSKGYLSKVFTGKKPVTWNFAEWLKNNIPQRSIEQWKGTSGQTIKAVLVAHINHK